MNQNTNRKNVNNDLMCWNLNECRSNQMSVSVRFLSKCKNHISISIILLFLNLLQKYNAFCLISQFYVLKFHRRTRLTALADWKWPRPQHHSLCAPPPIQACNVGLCDHLISQTTSNRRNVNCFAHIWNKQIKQVEKWWSCHNYLSSVITLSTFNLRLRSAHTHGKCNFISLACVLSCERNCASAHTSTSNELKIEMICHYMHCDTFILC